MTLDNRTPVAPSPLPTNNSPGVVAREPPVLNEDGIDTRRYLHLTQAEQIEWLDANGRRLQDYYLGMSAAFAYLKAQQTKEVTQ